MAYYNVCPDCGCNLDPSEKCDCKKQKSERVSVEEAARLLGITPQGVRVQMQRGLLDIGIVVPSVKGNKKNTYLIYRNKLNRVLGYELR